MQLNENRKVVEILWTGGYDSTFRIVQLSRLDIDIQPYYLSDNRVSEPNELKAISEITNELKKHRDTKCVFLPLIVVDMSERLENEKISRAYANLRKTDFFGTQYDWLARFAEVHQGIEMSIHEDDKAILLINKYGKLKRVEDETLGAYFVLDRENSAQDICTIFQHFHLPLAEHTKISMKEEYLRLGYAAVMEKTWFCFSPINGKPCGCCNPCRYTIEEGMKERFTWMALGRYHACRVLSPIKGVAKKVKSAILKKNRDQ